MKHLVELHGGQVQADSAGEGRGATFTVTLPTSTAGAAADPQRPTETIDHYASVSLGSMRILLVEDEPDTRDFLRQLLEGHGAVVETAASAHEALDAFRRQPPDVLISDIGLPEVDGYDLMDQIRRSGLPEGRSIPAIALTAYARAEDRTRALNAGFQRTSQSRSSRSSWSPASPASAARSPLASLAPDPDTSARPVRWLPCSVLRSRRAGGAEGIGLPEHRDVLTAQPGQPGVEIGNGERQMVNALAHHAGQRLRSGPGGPRTAPRRLTQHVRSACAASLSRTVDGQVGSPGATAHVASVGAAAPHRLAHDVWRRVCFVYQSSAQQACSCHMSNSRQLLCLAGAEALDDKTSPNFWTRKARLTVGATPFCERRQWRSWSACPDRYRC